MKNNDFATQVFLAIGLVFNYIKEHIANISLGLSVLLVLRYLFVVFGFEVMTLGIAFCLLIVSLTTSLPNKKENKNKHDRYY